MFLRFLLNIILITLLSLVYSCSEQADQLDEKPQGLPADSVTTVIPLGGNGAPYLPYEVVKIKREKLGLSDLNKGANSVEIRFWFSYPGMDSSQLLILRKQDKGWSGELINYTIFVDKSDKDNMRIDSITSVRRNGAPKSGWNHLIKNLSELKIKELPDMYQLLGQSAWFPHGNAVVIEIATTHTYKIYTYISPSELDDSHWEAKNVGKMVKLIESEFNFKRLR